VIAKPCGQQCQHPERSRRDHHDRLDPVATQLLGVLTRSAPNLGHLQTRNLYAAKISRWCADIVSGIAKTFPKAVGKRPASGRYLNQTIGISATNLSVRAHHEQE